MRPRRGPDEWRRQVFRSAVLPDAAKVVLLFLADRLKQDMTVSVPRYEVAAKLGKSERRISQRIAEAHAAGFLDTVTRGQKHRTAEYRATFPDPPLRVTDSDTLRGAETDTLRRPNQGLSGTHAVPPVVERNVLQLVTNRNVSHDERSA